LAFVWGAGPGREDVSVWVYEGHVKVEYQAAALSLSELSIEKKTGEITEVKNARRLETHFEVRSWIFGKSLRLRGS